MLSNVLCQFSSFADYANLNLGTEKLLSAFGNRLMPTTFRDSQNSIVVSLADPATPFFVQIFPFRIDVIRVSERKEGFAPEELGKIQKLFLDSMCKIEETFVDEIQTANRLAWYTEYTYFDFGDENEKVKFKNKFLRENDFYETLIPSSDFVVRYAGRKETSICDSREVFNIITTIENWKEDQGFVAKIASSAGYKIGVDINTIWENKKNRFSVQHYDEFMKIAVDLQNSVKESFLHEYQKL